MPANAPKTHKSDLTEDGLTLYGDTAATAATEVTTLKLTSSHVFRIGV